LFLIQKNNQRRIKLQCIFTRKSTAEVPLSQSFEPKSQYSPPQIQHIQKGEKTTAESCSPGRSITIIIGVQNKTENYPEDQVDQKRSNYCNSPGLMFGLLFGAKRLNNIFSKISQENGDIILLDSKSNNMGQTVCVDEEMLG